jgi:serine/threonine protein phosphatase 1
LRGNHEQMMVEALTEGRASCFQRWLKMGGTETLASYGGTRKKLTPERARGLVGLDHLRFLAQLPLMHIEGSYLFVHAGVEPGVPLQQQDSTRLLTIRRRFLKKPHGLPFTIIHGHTPTNGSPRFGTGRIGVDTGAYFTGILTAVAIEPGLALQRFIQVSDTDEKPGQASGISGDGTIRRTTLTGRPNLRCWQSREEQNRVAG